MAEEARSPTQQPAITVTKVDRPEVGETFADSIENVVFDGQSVRIEFCVTRLEQQPNKAPSARRYPSCRMALTPGAAVELMNHLQRVMQSMVKAGVLKSTANPAAPPSEP